MTRLMGLFGSLRELALVLGAAAVGLGVQAPLAALDRHQGINVLLAVLVFATALTIEPTRLRRLRTQWRPLVLCLLAGTSALPALAWVAGQLVAAGPLRDGVLAIGVAPCEIASVATTFMAGGDVVLAGGVLVGSTLLTVATAGPILSLEEPGVAVHTTHLVGTLAVVVLLPLVAALSVRSLVTLPERAEQLAGATSLGAVAALVALIAAETHLSGRYLPVAGALVVMVAASAVLGRILGARSAPATGRAVLLTTSMRDFAVAAGLAAAAFGARAAGPLGLYGIMVLAWGTGCAAALRAHHEDRVPVDRSGP